MTARTAVGVTTKLSVGVCYAPRTMRMSSEVHCLNPDLPRVHEVCRWRRPYGLRCSDRECTALDSATFLSVLQRAHQFTCRRSIVSRSGPASSGATCG